MAVYRHLDERTLRQCLRPFRLGDLVGARPLPAGPINTIYEILTTRGRYILRILGNHNITDARFEEALLLRLCERGLPVPRMVGAGRRGHVLPIAPRQMLSVFAHLPGREIAVFEVSAAHCLQVGTILAGLHIAGKGLGRRRQNRFDPQHLRRLLIRAQQAQLLPRTRRDLASIATVLTDYKWDRMLPRGIVHGDLFIDKARFTAGTLCGLLDFEMAATGPYLYDLAVALCDWAFLHDRFMPAHARALLQGYEAGRSLSATEREGLYGLCNYAAARFALTRLYDFEVCRAPSSGRLYKDYRHFVSRLAALQTMGEGVFCRAVARLPAQVHV